MRFLSNLVASALGTLVALGIFFFVGMLMFFIVVAASDQTPSVSDDSVLVLELTGAIPEVVSGDPLRQVLADEPSYDLRGLVSAIDKAAVDDRIDAIWMQVKDVATPWANLQEVRTALLRFKESGKPIIASSNDHMMAETEYFLASTADSVFASEQAMFEFNGFFLSTMFFQGLLERLEVEPQIIRAGTYKAAVEPFIREDLSPENEEQLTALLETQNAVFMEAVAESRGTTPEALNQLVNQRALISAEEAHEAGLLDGLLYEDQVVEAIKKRLGYDMDDDLNTTTMRAYVRVPPSEAGLEVNDEGEIAIVYAEGAIVSGESSPGDPLSGVTLGAETFLRAMEEARESDDVQAIVVRINSPGGSASASDAMWRAIRLTADEKPVIVSMGNLAASGGYWMATGAETIIADPLTITGSIGVFAILMDASGLFESQLGITFDGVRTSPYADLFSGVRSLEAHEQDLLQGWVDDTYGDFLERVAESRSLDEARVDSIGQGRIWSGAHAVEIGLVDSLGTLKDAVAVAAGRAEIGEGPYRVRILPRPRSFIEELQRGLSARVGSAWSQWTRTPQEIALLEQARTLKSLMQEAGTVQARLPFDISYR
jgi:protease-4